MRAPSRRPPRPGAARLLGVGFSPAGTGSALPLTNSSQLTFQAVQPLPGCSGTSVPLTVTRSPTLVMPISQSAAVAETLAQPCETLVLPWSPSDHGAAWMNSPPQVSRWASSTSTT